MDKPLLEDSDDVLMKIVKVRHSKIKNDNEVIELRLDAVENMLTAVKTSIESIAPTLDNLAKQMNNALTIYTNQIKELTTKNKFLEEGNLKLMEYIDTIQSQPEQCNHSPVTVSNNEEVYIECSKCKAIIN